MVTAMHKGNIFRLVREWLANRLGIEDEAARNGQWWEIDLVIVIFCGSILAGLIAWAEL
jgi:hypothetical protein